MEGEVMINQELCKVVESAPYGARVRKWTGRDDNLRHHHGVVKLSESPLYLELFWRSTANSPIHRVGFFRLNLLLLLLDNYVRKDPIDSPGSEVRLRIVHSEDEDFYIQASSDKPRLQMV